MNSIQTLTNREREIIHLISYEYSTREIAQKLYISFETVKTHRTNIFTKLDVANVAGVVRQAFIYDLIDNQEMLSIAS